MCAVVHLLPVNDHGPLYTLQPLELSNKDGVDDFSLYAGAWFHVDLRGSNAVEAHILAS